MANSKAPSSKKNSSTATTQPETDTSQDPKLAQETQLAQAVGRLGNSRLSYLVGSAILLLSVVGFVFAIRWDGHFYDRRNCTKIEVVQQRIFKINSCDGTWEEIPSTAEKSAS